MNLKEELLNLPTVVKVEITKNVHAHGIPATGYKIFTKHPLTGKMYFHLFELANEINKAGALMSMFKSYLKDWWKTRNLEDAYRG